MQTPLVVKSADLKGTVDVGIVTMREDEATAILSRFDFHLVAHGTRMVDIALLRPKDGTSTRIAHVRCEDQGPDAANRTTGALIEDLAPKLVLLVGIAGALPNEDICLGDIAISSHVYDTRLGANKPGGKREFALRQPPLHPRVLDWVAHLPSIERRLDKWNSDASIGAPRPTLQPLESDCTGNDEHWRKNVLSALTHHFGKHPPRTQPRAAAVAFASGSELTKDPATVSGWLPAARDAKAIEMELVGALLACEGRYDGNNVPVLSIRGISDVVGYSRQVYWTGYACNAAGAFTKALLRSGALTDHPRHETVARGRQSKIRRTPLTPGHLLTLGRSSMQPKSVLPDRIAPTDLFFKMAEKARSKGKDRPTIGWNARPVPQLGIIQFAYLQQLVRMIDWGFKVKIVIYDICTTTKYRANELETLVKGMQQRLMRFRGISKLNITSVTHLLRDRDVAQTLKELFQIGRPAIGESIPSANDPATTLDNLLCMAVENWQRYDILVAGWRDANDFWALLRTRMADRAYSDEGLSLILEFPKLSFGAATSPEDLTHVPTEDDSENIIAGKLASLDESQLHTVWDALIAPCENSEPPDKIDAGLLAHKVHQCFSKSPFLKS